MTWTRKDAVTQTEQAVQEAQKAIGEARIFLNAKQASTHRFESEGARTKAGAVLRHASSDARYGCQVRGL